MAEVKAFKALRFTKKAGAAPELACPPYDIISEDERKAYLAQNGYNIIRLELPREGENPYEKAGETLSTWLENGILARDEKDSFYIYEEEFEVHGEVKRLKGIVGRVGLEPFENGVVLPHEETLSKAKADRFNLMLATNCNFSSIYSLYFDENKSISGRLDALSSGKPDMEFTSADGIIHRVWIVSDENESAAISLAFADKKLYIADGHHRYETALNYRRHMRENDGEAGSVKPYDYVMMTLVNMAHPGLVVFPTHRVVKGLDGFDSAKLLDKCEAYFSAADIARENIDEKLAEAAAKGKKAFALYHGGRVSLLTLKNLAVMGEKFPAMSEAYRGLDVTVLHTLVLEGILGIDKENMANQVNLSYTRDMDEAISLVDKNEANCAFIINPTLVDEIASVAGAGEKMPQKSTYFYPKLITGHVMNQLL